MVSDPRILSGFPIPESLFILLAYASKSLPLDMGKVVPQGPDEEYTQKSGMLFADP